MHNVECLRYWNCSKYKWICVSYEGNLCINEEGNITRMRTIFIMLFTSKSKIRIMLVAGKFRLTRYYLDSTFVSTCMLFHYQGRHTIRLHWITIYNCFVCLKHVLLERRRVSVIYTEEILSQTSWSIRQWSFFSVTGRALAILVPGSTKFEHL